MNDTTNGTVSIDATKIIGAISHALRKHPLFQVIFGIIFLTLLLCIYAITFPNRDTYLPRIALVGLFLESIFALVMIRSVEVGKSRQELAQLRYEVERQEKRSESFSKQLEEDDGAKINLPKGPLRNHFISAISNTRKAIVNQNATFRMEIESAIAKFEMETAEWSNGCLTTDALNYERIVYTFYKQAEQSVFATSNESYLKKYWINQSAAETFLDAHRIAYERANVMVTRIFVFANNGSITGDYLAIIERQDTLPFVQARVLIVDEHPSLKLAAADLLKDFVIIDRGSPSQTIGIESSPDLSSVCKWIFRPDPAIEQTAQSMSQKSISVAQVKARAAASGGG